MLPGFKYHTICTHIKTSLGGAGHSSSSRALAKYTPGLGFNPQHCNNEKIAGHWWLTPVILPTQEAEIRRIVV
jgi:hypothetical protein